MACSILNSAKVTSNSQQWNSSRGISALHVFHTWQRKVRDATNSKERILSAQKDLVVSWPSAHSLPLFNQCVPGSVFVFCRAEPPEESLPASKRLDSMVCTEKLTTAEHDGGGLRLTASLFFLYQKEKKRFEKKVVKGPSAFLRKQDRMCF